MKRMILFPLLVACAPVAAGSLPFARSGLLDTPMASVLRHTEIEAGAGFTAFSYQGADSSSESDFAIAGHIEVGLLERAQLGVTYLGAGGISGQARVLVLRESITRPGLALGVENIIGEKNYEFFEGDSGLYAYPQSQNFSAYVVLSKNFDYVTGTPICLSLGWGMGRFLQDADRTSDGGFDNPIPGLFGSFEVHPNSSTSMAIEWDGRDANIGGSYRFSRLARVSLAVAEFEQLFRGDVRDEQDVMQSAKFTVGFQLFFGPFLNRTTLEPAERLRRAQNEEALRQLEEERRHAMERIEELLRTMED